MEGDREMKRQIILSLVLLFGLTNLFASSQKERANYRLASSYERKGEYAKAESLYVDLYNFAPDNYSYFTQYKNILIRQNKFDELQPLLEERYKNKKNDQYLRIELSILYFTRGDIKKARTHWEAIFSSKTFKMHSSYSNSIYSKTLEYRQGGSFYKIVNELRKISNRPDLLVRYNFQVALRYRNWEQALDEIEFIIQNNPTNLKYVRSYLFRQDPSSILYQKAIERLSNIHEPEARVLLSNIYLHRREDEKAFRVLCKMNEDPQIQTALVSLAQTLLKKEQFDLAIQAAERALNFSRSQSQSNQMRFLMAESLRDKFEAKNTRESLIQRPFSSAFTDIPIQSFEREDIYLIEQAYDIYDSLSRGRNQLFESATLALIDIDRFVHKDFDGALKRAEELLSNISIEKRVILLDMIAELKMAKGDVHGAKKFILGATDKYSLMVHEEDKLLISDLHISVLTGETDFLREKTNLLLSLISNKDPLYNDILNYAAFTGILAKDSLRQAEWGEAERALIMQDPAKAVGIYWDLSNVKSDAAHLYMLRYLDCVIAMKDMDAERKFWQKNIASIDEFEMADYFTLAYADFLEREKKNEKAVEIYGNFLLSYQESMYFEQVREYMRHIKPTGE